MHSHTNPKAGTAMFRTLLPALLALSMIAPLHAAAASKADKARAEIRKVSNETLTQLYKVYPEAKKQVEGAAGYATFSNFGMKIFFVGGGSGKGLVVNNQTRKETYMRMAEAQAGLGVGAKKFRVIFVFQAPEAMNAFTEQGWEFGGQATAAAKAGDQGDSIQGAVAVSPGVWMYQLTDKGLAAEITAKGTKYWKDGDLN
jgi:lipid-binding SYLF domain-containing protein